MALIACFTLASCAYCLFYTAFCIKNKNALAVMASLFLALLPVAVFILCVIARVGAM